MQGMLTLAPCNIVLSDQTSATHPAPGMRAMSFLMRKEDTCSAYTSPFCRSTTYCNQDVHIGVEVGHLGP